MANVVNPKPSSRSHASIALTTAADGVSESINLTGLTLSCVQMSTDWTDAGLGFKASIDGSTNFYSMYTSSGDFLTYQTSANRVVAFDPAVFAGVQRLQVVSQTTAGVAVAQAAARTLILGLSEYVEAN